MWRSIQVPLVVLTLQSPALASDMRWPSPHIAVPPLVQQFIVGECLNYRGTTHESTDACILAERYGYRAVVMMLMDDATGGPAAERYRECRNGLGDIGGRFHRNRATCIAGRFGYKWRFEFAQEAAVQMPPHRDDGGLRTAATGGPGRSGSLVR